MTKRITLVAVGLGAGVGAGYLANPEEFRNLLAVVAAAAVRVWESVEANPGPALLAVGTFLLTVTYHKVKGKSLRESVEAAASRGRSDPAKAPEEPENPVVTRAKARTMRSQLLADQIGIQNRQRKLPEEIARAEREATHAAHCLTDAKKNLEAKQKANDDAFKHLEALRFQYAECEAELEEIEAELEKLAELV
jgi:hypothetical protein